MAIRWASTAAEDFREIIEWIAENHSVDQASAFIDNVDSRLSRIGQFPESGRVVPELERQNITTYREVVMYPWRVLYSVQGDVVWVVAVFDGRRNIEDILLRRNLR